MLLKKQNDVSLQRGMPVEVVADSQAVVSISAETVQLYYYDTGALTIDAGEAAGTAVIAKLAQGGVLDDIGAKIGNHLNTSFAFVTGTVLTTEVEFPWDIAENGDNSSGTGQLDAIVADFANGEYCVDYRNGVIYGKKATTGVSDTANYKVAQQSSGGSTSVTSSENIAKIGGETVVADNGAGAAVTKTLPVGGKYNAAAQTYSDGDIVMTQYDVSGNLKVTGGSSSVSAEFTSPSDFTATYTSASTITLSSLTITIADASQIVYVKQTLSDNTSATYVAGSGGVAFGLSSNVLTVYQYGSAITTLASGDVYEVGINAQRKAYDPSTNSTLTSPLKNVWNQYTDAETLVSAQDLTDAYADFGAEIDTRGYTKLGVWVIGDVNDSENVNLKALVKHTSAGTDEYEIEASGGVKALWTTGASDSKAYYEFNIGAAPFVQLQAIAGTVGATAGDLTISITKIY